MAEFKLRYEGVAPPVNQGSFASVVSGEGVRKVPKQEHVLIISKEDNCEEEDSVRELVTGNLNPKTLKIGIKRTRDTRGGDLLLEVNSSKDLETLRTAISSNGRLKDRVSVRTPRKFDPKVIIFDVNKDISEGDLLAAIKGQNNLDDVVVIHKGSFGGKSGINHIIELDGRSFNKLMSSPRVHINWERYSFKEYIKPKQCFKCLKYGHIHKFCKSADTYCYKCGESDHEGKDCNKSKFSCRNCCALNTNIKDRKNQVKTDHRANDRLCGAYQKETDRLRTFINYG